MTHTHLIFVVLLLLLFSPSLLCSDAEAKIFKGRMVNPEVESCGVVSIYLSVYATKDGRIPAIVSRLCGGSAIKPFAILTSLYCMDLYESKEWKEGSGHNITVSFTNYRMEPYSLSFDKITVINHDSFYDPEKNKTDKLNIIDMALVFLPKNLTVMYPTLTDKAAVATTKVTVAGWGKVDADASKDFPKPLYQIPKDATTVADLTKKADLVECMKNKPKYNADKYIAGGDFYCLKTTEKEGPCVGDFGGPVYEQSGFLANTHVQVGIIIETAEDYCKTTAMPGKYFPVLRVDKFSSWIEANLKKYSGSSSGLIFSPVLLGLSALVSLFLL